MAFFISQGKMKITDTSLQTDRLLLRKYHGDDSSDIACLLKDKEVAATTMMLPYPCTEERSNELLQKYLKEDEEDKTWRWAITIQPTGDFIGGIKLAPNSAFNSAELGFWIGKRFWKQGYAFEAASTMVEFAFDKLHINRLEAHAMTENSGSLKLLKRLGFSQEGIHPELVVKWGEYKDVITFGYLRKNYTKKI